MPDSTIANLLTRNWKILPQRVRQIFAQEGWTGLRRKVTAALRHSFETYPGWIRKYDTLSDSACKQIRDEISRWPTRPLISIVMPVYNTDPRWLRAAIRSVQAQLYPNWELCISDDASTLDGVHSTLKALAVQDRRIRVVFRDSNGNILGTKNLLLYKRSDFF